MAQNSLTEGNSRTATLLLTLPGLVWLTALLILPCGLILAYSFLERGTYGGIVYNLNFANFTRSFESVYVSIFLTSLRIASFATLFALIIAYPAAYAISRLPARQR